LNNERKLRKTEQIKVRKQAQEKNSNLHFQNREYQLSSAIRAGLVVLWISGRIKTMVAEGCWGERHKSFLDQPNSLKS
jgi:hypothetical protein